LGNAGEGKMFKSLKEEYMRERPFEADMKKFAQILDGDPVLQKTLKDAVENGVNREGFRDLYIKLASSKGLHFDADQLEIAMQEQKQGKDKLLPTFAQKLVALL
jgi:hypothetical protein